MKKEGIQTRKRKPRTNETPARSSGNRKGGTDHPTKYQQVQQGQQLSDSIESTVVESRVSSYAHQLPPITGVELNCSSSSLSLPLQHHEPGEYNVATANSALGGWPAYSSTAAFLTPPGTLSSSELSTTRSSLTDGSLPGLLPGGTSFYSTSLSSITSTQQNINGHSVVTTDEQRRASEEDEAAAAANAVQDDDDDKELSESPGGGLDEASSDD
jgi:hypothetical protein